MKGLGNCSLLAQTSGILAAIRHPTPLRMHELAGTSPQTLDGVGVAAGTQSGTLECESALVEPSYKHPPQGLPVSL